MLAGTVDLRLHFAAQSGGTEGICRVGKGLKGSVRKGLFLCMPRSLSLQRSCHSDSHPAVDFGIEVHTSPAI